MLTSQSMHAVFVVPTFIVRSLLRVNGQLLTQAAITGGWGETPLPLCVGHEIIGRLHSSINTSFPTSQTSKLLLGASLDFLSLHLTTAES